MKKGINRFGDELGTRSVTGEVADRVGPGKTL
jgi:hypothetical protein